MVIGECEISSSEDAVEPNVIERKSFMKIRMGVEGGREDFSGGKVFLL